jgi:hypothetical protein
MDNARGGEEQYGGRERDAYREGHDRDYDDRGRASPYDRHPR